MSSTEPNRPMVACDGTTLPITYQVSGPLSIVSYSPPARARGAFEKGWYTICYQLSSPYHPTRAHTVMSAQLSRAVDALEINSDIQNIADIVLIQRLLRQILTFKTTKHR